MDDNKGSDVGRTAIRIFFGPLIVLAILILFVFLVNSRVLYISGISQLIVLLIILAGVAAFVVVKMNKRTKSPKP